MLRKLNLRLLLLLLLAALPGEACADPAPDPTLEYAERARKLDRKNPGPWLELADFCESRLLWPQREEALQAVVGIAPDHAEAHARLGEGLYQGRWIPIEASEALEIAENEEKGLAFYGKGWVPEAEAERLRAADSKTAGWNVLVRIDTPHLTLYSAPGVDFARYFAAVLEGEFALYHRLYGKRWGLDPAGPPLPVYLFADPKTYQASATAITPQARPDLWPCMFNNRTGILYVGMTPAMAKEPFDSAATTFLAVFEVIRALDDTQAPCLARSPRWLQIGRADYFGYALNGRRILPGSTAMAPADAADILQEGLESVSIAALMNLSQAAYDKDVRRNYLWSWAWVHFLCHGEGGKHATAFLEFLDSPVPKSSVEGFEKAVGPVKDLEPAFKTYVEKELLPSLGP